jgi:outer membrane murein-binding lipoprotein Lpp
MIRRRLLIVATVVASVVLAACSDMTAPKGDDSCPVSSGSSTCKK